MAGVILLSDKYENLCHVPFTPAAGVQIPLGTPNELNGLGDFLNPFLFCKNTIPTAIPTIRQ